MIKLNYTCAELLYYYYSMIMNKLCFLIPQLKLDAANVTHQKTGWAAFDVD